MPRSKPAASVDPDGRALPPPGTVLLFEKTLSKSDVRVGMVIVPKATAAAHFNPLPAPGRPSNLTVRGPDPASPGRVLEQSTFFRAYHNRRPAQNERSGGGASPSGSADPSAGATPGGGGGGGAGGGGGPPPSTAGVMFVVEPIKDLFGRRAAGDPVSVSIVPADGSLWIDARAGAGTAAVGGPAAAAAAVAAAKAATAAAKAARAAAKIGRAHV